MRITPLALAGLAAAAASSSSSSSSALVSRKQGRPDITGSYWDVTVSRQAGRPGYEIRDLSVTFYSPKFDVVAEAKCHYSFVPQGTRPPSEVNECSSGLEYTWDYTTLSLRQNVNFGNETLLVFGNAVIEAERRSDGAGGSSAKGAGRIEIHHYCNSIGCSDPDGCVTLTCRDGLVD